MCLSSKTFKCSSHDVFVMSAWYRKYNGTSKSDGTIWFSLLQPGSQCRSSIMHVHRVKRRHISRCHVSFRRQNSDSVPDTRCYNLQITIDDGWRIQIICSTAVAIRRSKRHVTAGRLRMIMVLLVWRHATLLRIPYNAFLKPLFLYTFCQYQSLSHI